VTKLRRKYFTNLKDPESTETAIFAILTLMKHLLSFSLLATVALSLSACHTIKGVGQDVSAAGHDVSKAANKVEQKINN